MQLNTGWSESLKKKFQDLDMLNIFVNESLCDLKAIELGLQEKMKQNWEIEVLEKPKLRTYIKIEHYDKSNKGRLARSLMVKFRLGILPIKLETGRYNSLKLEDRICEVTVRVMRIPLKMKYIF